MRLTETERKAIDEAVLQAFGPEAKVRLFGSRLDDGRKGGDIDLLVECPRPIENAGLAAARMAAKIQIRLGQRKVDVLYTWPGLAQSPAHRTALAEGKEL